MQAQEIAKHPSGADPAEVQAKADREMRRLRALLSGADWEDGAVTEVQAVHDQQVRDLAEGAAEVSGRLYALANMESGARANRMIEASRRALGVAALAALYGNPTLLAVEDRDLFLVAALTHGSSLGRWWWGEGEQRG